MPLQIDELLKNGVGLFVGFLAGKHLSDALFTSSGVLHVKIIVGEQFVEIPDSLSRKEKKDPSLLAMDVFRWVLIAAIAVFTVMGLRGI